ncbi:kelch repeat protein, partial [Ostertagia ostertagi]
EVCSEFLVKELGPSNCLGIRKLADVYVCPELLRCADKYILHNFQDVVCTEEFYQLPVDRLIELISNEGAPWIRRAGFHNCASVDQVRHGSSATVPRKGSLLEHVRFSLCNPKFLVDTISKDELVMTNATCRDFVDEAKAGDNYLLRQSFAHERPNEQRPRMRPRKRPMSNKVLYAVGGTCDKEKLDSVEFLDLRVGNTKWQRAAPMIKKRYSAGVAVLYNMLYAFGGLCKRDEDSPSRDSSPVNNE